LEEKALPTDSLPVLIALTGPLNGERWVVQKNTLIGRGEDCDIVIPDRKISRHHARINLSDSSVILEDLNSKNGTHHNGDQINEKVVLNEGDIFQIALSQKFTFLSADATVPLDMVEAQEADGNQEALVIEKLAKKILIRGVEITPPLSAAQYSLLEILASNDGLVVSRESLIKQIWGQTEAANVSDQALDALVRRLRDRIAQLDKQHQYIVTVRGHGLRLENTSA
jgi:hypothetical protein